MTAAALFGWRTRLGAFSLSLAWSVFASAATARIWVTETASDFAAGVAHGVSGVPSGGLELSRRAERIGGLTEATLFCAAEGSSGVAFFGTGDEGKVYRQDKGQPAKLLATLPEKEVTALFIGADGILYAGTSPRGKVYRIEDGKPRVYFDPGAQYIWALASGRAGSLFVATGFPGKIFRVTAAGQGVPYYDSQDEHVRCLAFDAQNRLWAGTSGKGLLLRFDSEGKATTVYDSDKTEISALAVGSGGRVWAAAVTAKTQPSIEGPHALLPGAAPEKKPEAASGSPEPTGSVTVTVSTSLAPPALPPAPKGAESSEVVAIDRDDAASVVWSSNDELIYALRRNEEADLLEIATGPKGHLYFLRQRQAGLAESFEEKRVVAILPDVAVSDSPAAAYRLTPSLQGEFASAVKDTGRVSRFGAFRREANLPPGTVLRFSFRSGNSSLPDATWSPWSAPAEEAEPSAAVAAPPARYLQWKALFESPRSGLSPRLHRVECAYQNRNSEPVVESVQAVSTNPPEAAAPAGATAEPPETETIFTGLEERPNASSPARARKRGLLTVSWKAVDPEGDELVYDLDFRADGSERWIPLRRRWKSPSFSFDSTLLPDGRYQFRVTASDRPSNPDDPKTGSKVSEAVLVDNTPPSIEVVKASRETSGAVINVRVQDASSPLAETEWSVNAGPWTRAAADDGMTDSPSESYTISLGPENHGAYLLIRATDAAGNAASKSLTVP